MAQQDKRPPIEGIRPDRQGRTDGIEPERREGQVTRSEAEGGVRPAKEGFKQPLPSHLSRLSRSIMQHMDGAVGTLILKLPGLARIIHDRRITEEMRAAAEAVKTEGSTDEAKKEFQIKEGKVQDLKQKTYENFLAARQMVKPQVQGEGASKDRPLSDFEKMVLERFEGGKELEQAIKEGKFKFSEKTLEQWKTFFEKFMGRTSKKSLDLAEIQEFLYRGMVKKDAAKAILISDIIQNSGKTEKFARFGVLYQKISSFLSSLVPGDKISKKALAEGLTSEELLYLAIQPPSAEAELSTGMKPKQGIFAAEATEARVAEELGITGGYTSSDGKIAAGRGKKKKGGLFGLFSGDEEPILEEQGRFIPWWSWGNLNRPGGIKIKRAFYAGVFIVFVILIILLIDRFLVK